MSKAVLVSIRPEWCAKIAFGEKTIEVRKTRPKLPTPFKCYIYMTNQKKGEDGWLAAVCAENSCYYGAGSVIGEFVCDRIVDWPDEIAPPVPLKDCCMTYSEVRHYGGTAETLYLWHISDLKIYDKPKKLTDFIRPKNCGYGYDCETCNVHSCATRPPQSWCYVEET